MSHRLNLVSSALVAFTASSAFAKDNLSIGIVTFSTSDIHTNQMVDTMAAEAKARQVADTARKSASAMSIFTALSMVIGAFIASAAAALGGSLRDEV